MLRQSGVILLFCVALSYQICHNGICDTDRCLADGDCPSCWACDQACGLCNAIPNCCMSHQVCPDYDGICDAEVDPTTCNYCDFNANQCKPGCIDNDNCEDGFDCIGHQCTATSTCTTDKDCNKGENVCDVENIPYTTCFYCENGECLPGCKSDDNCPTGYTCDTNDNKCHPPPGAVLIDSITVHTKTGCSECSKEGVVLSLRGKTNTVFPQGVPCSTGTLNHAASVDFDGSNGSSARFDGKISGQADDGEIDMMGGCYEAPLKAELIGGSVVWKGGEDDWEPKNVCVDWRSNNFAFECGVTKTGAKTWNLVSCHDLTPHTSCNDVLKYM